MELLRKWLLGLICASLLSAVAQQLVQSGPMQRVTRFVCGVLLCVLLLSPVVRPDRSVYSGELSRYQETVDLLTKDVEKEEDRLLRAYIQERSAAYIVDEAERLDLKVEAVSVTARWSGESWVPYEISIRAAGTEDGKKRLASFLNAEMGIPPERQYWEEE